jgi:hypothetical protein
MLCVVCISICVSLVASKRVAPTPERDMQKLFFVCCLLLSLALAHFLLPWSKTLWPHDWCVVCAFRKKNYCILWTLENRIPIYEGRKLVEWNIQFCLLFGFYIYFIFLIQKECSFLPDNTCRGACGFEPATLEKQLANCDPIEPPCNHEWWRFVPICLYKHYEQMKMFTVGRYRYSRDTYSFSWLRTQLRALNFFFYFL